LEQVNEPANLRHLSYRELEQLAQEIREAIIATVLQNGGHLASNLGVVEITIALHRVFNSPIDKIIWDTGNQCYAHKLLTGRREMFPSIRKAGGLSGFADPAESPHDIFGAGHAGTGLSAALGIALGLRLQQDAPHGYVVAVVGDGALTAGLSYEALNNIGHIRPQKFIIILNDNGMSISENIGWLTHWRNRLTHHPYYHQLLQEGQKLARKVPQGEVAWRLAKRMKDELKGFFIPTRMWEDMGFRYEGPIDGHNIRELEEALTAAKRLSDSDSLPFIHVVTHKGKGYPPAELDPVKYHQPASPSSTAGSSLTYSQVFADTVACLMEKDPRVVAISAAMLEGTGLVQVKRRFPERVVDVGVAEQHAVTVAAGMARAGLRPIVAIYSTFLQRAFDQIVHDVCLQNLPVIFAVDRAGLVGEDGKTHQGVFDISYFRCIPNVLLAAPKDENELQHLLYTALQAGRPFAIRYPRGNGHGVVLDQELKEIPIGTGELLRDGNDVAILALGSTVHPSLEAAEILLAEGIDCAVVNNRFVKPLDADLILNICRRTKRALTVEEGTIVGGFGSAVQELLASKAQPDIAVRLLGLPDKFIDHGSQAALRAKLSLDAQGIARQVMVSFPDLALKSGATVR